jgi:O-antigen/teichoic acid export membrane protein
MLMFSSLARAGSQLLPVLVMYAFGLVEEAAFWLLMAGIIGLQSLLFLGAPQVLIRTLAYSSARPHGNEADWPEAEEAAQAHDHNERVALADLVFLMGRLFLAASIIVPLLIALGGSLAIANVVEQTGSRGDAWLAWVATVVFLPLRIIALRDLTFLHGMGVIARPRCIDGVAWTTSGLLAALVFALSKSLAASSIASQLPLLLAIHFLGRDALAAGWTAHRGAAGRENWRRTFRSVWQPAWRAGTGQALSLGARQGSGIILAQYLAAAEVAGFLMAMNVVVVVMVLGGAPAQAAIPSMSKAYALGDTAQHCRIASKVLTRSLLLVAVACGGIGLAIIPLLAVLGVPESFVSPTVWLLLSLTLLAQRYGAVHLQHYSITNHIFWHWLDGATGVVNLILCFALIPPFGVVGAAASNLVSVLCFYAWIPGIYVQRRFGGSWAHGTILVIILSAAMMLVKVASDFAILEFGSIQAW